MCDPRPGARCSADTWRELLDARRRVAAARADADRFPDDPGAILRLERAHTMLEAKQAAFDSSIRGQQDLVAAIAAASPADHDELDALRTRLYAGRATRVAQKRALAAARGESLAQGDLDVDRTLKRLRHPDAELVRHGQLRRDDPLGFLVRDHETPLAPAESLRPADVYTAVLQARHAAHLSQDGFVAVWSTSAGIGIGSASLLTTAAAARRASIARNADDFHDLQLGAPVALELQAVDPSRALAAVAPLTGTRSEDVLFAVATVRQITGSRPSVEALAELIRLADIDVAEVHELIARIA